MKNFVQVGNVLSFIAAADHLSGELVKVGSLVGFSVYDVLTGAAGELSLSGVYKVLKEAPLVISKGDKLYFDESEKKVTKTSDGNTFAGWAAENAASSDTEVELKLAVGEAVAQAAVVSFVAGSNLVGVDGTGSNAAPLAGTETRLDALDTAVGQILTALKNAKIMASA